MIGWWIGERKRGERRFVTIERDCLLSIYNVLKHFLLLKIWKCFLFIRPFFFFFFLMSIRLVFYRPQKLINLQFSFFIILCTRKYEKIFFTKTNVPQFAYINISGSFNREDFLRKVAF